ncbi:MAG TPA: hypothetical protein VMJ10_36300 [Kofleriaceae bacterium]|nr:hypothetical protein [Kofleriaceae bacterium]
MRAVVIAAALVVATRAARAYPQFQLSKDQTCTACHIDPAGGLLLNENGLSTAQSIATYDVPPEAAHGALVGPSWLEAGAELRAGAGFVDSGRGPGGGAYPMQADGEVALHGHGFTLMGTFGPQMASSASDIIASREHWLMWQPDASSTDGLYIRVGRFLPVFGLRLAEHDVYTRQYGPTPLYGEAYGAAVEYIEPGWEVHATGFVHDPIQDSVQKGDGGALYGEARMTKALSLGLEGFYATSDVDARWYGGATAKYWIAPVLFEAEVIAIRQSFDAGSARDQLASYLVGSWFVHDGWMVDIGVGQFDEDLHVAKVDLECLDANVHWFLTSHWELLETNRVQTIALGTGGATSGFALLQFHYRL